MSTGNTDYVIRAIPQDVLAELRKRDDAGNPPRPVTEDGEGGNPLRCCLSRSKPHESIALVSYAPLRRWARETGATPGPYDEVGPVFIHPHDCGGPGTAGTAGTAGFPDAMRGARRVLRAYRADGTILGGRYVAEGEEDGTTVEEGLTELYADPEVALVHVRAVEFGCFLLETRRG
ncbi:hypothetical protein GCM10010218_30720 [Streptomyces mashuensis]|uniref:DUF1203 domain-containing protein n=1 Tax=Streptomyces mashuensis TaxID=33904 RepID=A0A919B2Q4_9ACTN|nr:DUF1203 domain-containing protein [Streptomyces mashuensis]GHF47257.1 hypothetical protein GCM10010218_30720 [Streptomyces mashuensis]